MTLAISRCLLLLASVVSFFGLVGAAPTAAQTSTIKFGASYAVQEGVGGVQVTVTRSGDTTGAATVDYATSSGTASERTDFIPALGTLRFGPGETTKTFTVLIIDNFTPESAETVDLMLFNPTGGAALSMPDAAVVTINDDDSASSSANPVDDSPARSSKTGMPVTGSCWNRRSAIRPSNSPINDTLTASSGKSKSRRASTSAAR